MKIRMAVTVLILATATIGGSRSALAASPADKVIASLNNYMKAWNEPSSEKRKAFLQTAWSDNGTYTDPTADIAGRDGLVSHIGEFLSNPQFKGASFVRASEIDVHHQVFRFEWIMKDSSGKRLVVGMDCGEFNDDGAITKIVGFFGPIPELKQESN